MNVSTNFTWSKWFVEGMHIDFVDLLFMHNVIIYMYFHYFSCQGGWGGYNIAENATMDKRWSFDTYISFHNIHVLFYLIITFLLDWVSTCYKACFTLIIRYIYMYAFNSEWRRLHLHVICNEQLLSLILLFFHPEAQSHCIMNPQIQSQWKKYWKIPVGGFGVFFLDRVKFMVYHFYDIFSCQK